MINPWIPGIAQSNRRRHRLRPWWPLSVSWTWLVERKQRKRRGIFSISIKVIRLSLLFGIFSCCCWWVGFWKQISMFSLLLDLVGFLFSGITQDVTYFVGWKSRCHTFYLFYVFIIVECWEILPFWIQLRSWELLPVANAVITILHEESLLTNQNHGMSFCLACLGDPLKRREPLHNDLDSKSKCHPWCVPGS